MAEHSNDAIIKINNELYNEVRNYCDDKGIRLINFIEDALECAIYEDQESNEEKETEDNFLKKKKTSLKNKSNEFSPTNVYEKNKPKYSDHILFIQCGSFFEVYDDDALICSEVFGWKTFDRGEYAVSGIPVYRKGFREILQEAKKPYVIIEQTVDEKDTENPIKRIITEIFP